jgi:hypothetical protein
VADHGYYVADEHTNTVAHNPAFATVVPRSELERREAELGYSIGIAKKELLCAQSIHAEALAAVHLELELVKEQLAATGK